MGEAMLKDLIESVLPGKDNATVNTGCRFCRLFLVQIIYIKYEVYMINTSLGYGPSL